MADGCRSASGFWRCAQSGGRDAMGRIQGTEQTDKYGKTTWRDAQGRIQGTKR